MCSRTTLPRAFLLAVVCAWTVFSSALSAQAPAPRPEHHALEVFVGTWNLEGDIKAVPAAGLTDSGHVVYKHVSQMINGGFFLETRRTGTGTRGPVSELFVYSCNAVAKTCASATASSDDATYGRSLTYRPSTNPDERVRRS